MNTTNTPQQRENPKEEIGVELEVIIMKVKIQSINSFVANVLDPKLKSVEEKTKELNSLEEKIKTLILQINTKIIPKANTLETEISLIPNATTLKTQIYSQKSDQVKLEDELKHLGEKLKVIKNSRPQQRKITEEEIDAELEVDIMKAKIRSINSLVTDVLDPKLKSVEEKTKELKSLEEKMKTLSLQINTELIPKTTTLKTEISLIPKATALKTQISTQKSDRVKLEDELKHLEEKLKFIKNSRPQTEKSILTEFEGYILTSKNKLESLDHYKERSYKIIKEHINNPNNPPSSQHRSYGVIRQSRKGGKYFSVTYCVVGAKDPNRNRRFIVEGDYIYTAYKGEKRSYVCAFTLKALLFYLSEGKIYLINTSESIADNEYCRVTYCDNISQMSFEEEYDMTPTKGILGEELPAAAATVPPTRKPQNPHKNNSNPNNNNEVGYYSLYV